MRDHRADATTAETQDITELVETHHTKHPGSVKRTPKATARARAKRAAKSRKVNR